MSITWGGLQEFTTDLRNLPDSLKAEGADIVREYAGRAETAVIQAYPLGPTGNLRNRVTYTEVAGALYGVNIEIASRAPHAFIYERGTVRRSYKGKDLGRMPAGNVFIPTMQRHRRQMDTALEDMLRRHGLLVTRAA